MAQVSSRHLKKETIMDLKILEHEGHDEIEYEQENR
jgi:hypothetical protein